MDALVRSQVALAKTDGLSFDEAVAGERQSALAVDVSYSMNDTMTSGERRIDSMRTVVGMLMQTNPIPVAEFGLNGFEKVRWVREHISEPTGDTPMGEAIRFLKAEGATHVILVSDGIPSDEDDALKAAKAFGGVIDTFFIGDPGDAGAKFMRKVARITGGTSNTTDLSDLLQLTTRIRGLLGDGTHTVTALPNGTPEELL